MKIQLDRIFVMLALVSILLPFVSFFVVGDIPPTSGNLKGCLTIVGDFLSSQMIGVVISIVLFFVSKMFEKHF